MPAQLHSPMGHGSCCALINAEQGSYHRFCCAPTVAARQLHVLQHLLLSGRAGSRHTMRYTTVHSR